MGSLYGEDDGPSMCYNSVKTWHLGWLQNYTVHIQANSLSEGDELWSGKLYGSVDVSSADPSNDAIIIKLDGTSMGNLYISFNRKRGFNEGTKEGGDSVLIHTKKGEEYDHAMSDLLAIMDGGDEYRVTIHGVTVIIAVRNILIGSDGQKYADIQIASPGASDDSTSDCSNGISYAASYITLGGEIVGVAEKSCNWLENQPDTTRETICSRDIQLGDVLKARDACPKACGECFSSPSPSPSPSSEPHSCTESPGALFAEEYQMLKGEIVGVKTQTCSWLSALTRKKKRRKICSNDISYGDIKSASEVCPYSCNICSEAPSSSPTLYPSSTPSSTPSDISDGSTSACEDDDDLFLFKAKKRKGNIIGAKKINTCGWLKAQPQDKIDKSCTSDDSYGEYLPSQYVCKSTCGIGC